MTVPWSDPSGRFELTDTILGEGGYGVVCLARDRSVTPAVDVAAKKLDLCQLREDQVAREVNAFRRIQEEGSSPCEYVVQLLADAVEEGVAHYLFFPYCAGGDLLDRTLSMGGLKEEVARPLFAQMTRGVAHLHDLGVAHRDIKLENFFLTASGDVRLGDLGLAALSESRDPAASAPLLCSEWAGSESYAAPEVWAVELQGRSSSHKSFDAYPADIWSLGICLFTMLNNMMPLDKAVPQADWRYDLLVQCYRSGASYAVQLHEQYGRKCTLSISALGLLAWMLAIDPKRRPSAAELETSAWRVEAAAAAPTASQSAPAAPSASLASACPALLLESELDSKYVMRGGDRPSGAWHQDHIEIYPLEDEITWRSASSLGTEHEPLVPKRQNAKERRRA